MIGHLLRPELEELIREKRWGVLREALSQFHPSDTAEILVDLPEADDVALFRILPRELAGKVFAYLPQANQEELVQSLTNEQMRMLLAEMSPDDQARVLEELPPEVTRLLLASLSPDELKAARDLLGYPEDTAGRFMTPEYVAIPGEFNAREALDHVRKTGRRKETLNVLYVVDERGKLIRDLRLGSLVMADPDAKVRDIQEGPLVALPATTDVEEVLRAFEKYDRIALPVTDADGHMLGIITIDDVLDVAREEATEDIQKIGGTEALDAPYLDVGYLQMLRKRGGWLSILFVGEVFTASAMTVFEDKLKAAAALGLFIPLIISSGGNSGSQAATLVIRALALDEVELGEWWRVLYRELGTSLTLGVWLGILGAARILLWHHFGWYDFGEHYLRMASVIGFTVLGVVVFGAVTGSMLPLLLQRVGLDPATSSAPFIATLVDVTGIIIYFSIAIVLLRGVLW